MKTQIVDARSQRTRQADAQLIAAAPELLVACKYALSQLDAAGIVCGDVRNAIAKAEGRSA